MNFHGLLESRGETRFQGGVSIFYLASTYHDSPQDIKYVNIKAVYWIWIDSLWKVESVTATTHQDEEVITLQPIPSLETVDGHDRSIIERLHLELE